MSAQDYQDTMTSFYREGIAVADPTIPYRLVGSYEYGNSLNLLERLIAQSTPDQIQVYDQMLNDRPEFSFYSGLNMGDPQLMQRAKFEQNFDRAVLDDEFKRTGLSWMIALAKVELGATLAAYGSSKTPFATFPPTQFDYSAFSNIMLDDLATHLRALATDPGLQEVIKKGRKADSWTVAYLRRVKLLRDIIEALKKFDDPSIAYRLEPYDRELKRLSDRLIENVTRYEVAISQTNQRQRTMKYQRNNFNCDELISKIRSAEAD